MKSNYPVSLLCKTLNISRSSYYAYKSGSRNKRSQQDEVITESIYQIFKRSRQTYGYPRMTDELRDQGWSIGKHRVARLMRTEGLQGRQRPKFKQMNQLDEASNRKSPNILKSKARPFKSNQIWQADITYIHTNEGWLYLSVVIDSWSRRIIGWSLQPNMKSSIVINSFEMARQRRGGNLPKGLLFHSDQGVQYSSGSFRKTLKKYNCTQSMSRRGNCYDNALTESFFSTLKQERIYRDRYANQQQATLIITEWIENFYNRSRRHTSLHGLSPVDYENQNN
jgi:transposase InsO family protein